MKYNVNRLVYPEGDVLDIAHALKINQLVDINGYPLRLPLPSPKMIAYTVCRIQKKSTRNEEITEYFLELQNRYELEDYVY